jgi:hypothetical protein
VTSTGLRHLQATRRVAHPASRVDALLRTDGARLVADATADAVVTTSALHERRFRSPAAPVVTVHGGDVGPAALRVGWDADARSTTSGWFPGTSRWWRAAEESTGWPTATFDLLVEPRRGGCQLAVLSDRPPGADLSTNRTDRHVRDQLAREAFERFLDALAARLEAACAV